MSKNPIRLTDLFRYYRGLPHQIAALQELEAEILKVSPNAFDRSQAWYNTWASAVESKEFGPAVQLIKEFEGCRLNAYLCPAGVPTIGFGNTRYPDGAQVKIGDSITQQRADEMLALEIKHTVDILKQSIPYWVEMNINQQSALISFAFNLGAYFYRSSGFGTITRALASKAWDQVPSALLLYRNPGSSFEAGLKRRRIAEGNLWAKAA